MHAWVSYPFHGARRTINLAQVQGLISTPLYQTVMDLRATLVGAECPDTATAKRSMFASG
jgi:hypothetical protein